MMSARAMNHPAAARFGDLPMLWCGSKQREGLHGL